MTPFFMAWGMFWIVPCPKKNWDEKKLKSMLLCMPIIGLFIGALWVGMWFGLNYLSLYVENGILICLNAAILACVPWIVSGFIHLDGFMDCMDAHLSRRGREERLRILKDSSVGAFSVITLVILAMITFGAWIDVILGAQLLPIEEYSCGLILLPWILVLITFVSRCLSVFFIMNFKPLENSSYKDLQKNIGLFHKILPVAMIAAAIALGIIFFNVACICLGVEIIAGVITTLILRKSFGGMSGDISGAAITISESAAIVCLAFII